MMYLIGSQVVLFAVVFLMYAKMCKMSNKLRDTKQQIQDTDNALFWDQESEHRIENIVSEINKLKERDEVIFDIGKRLNNKIKEVQKQIDNTDDVFFWKEGNFCDTIKQIVEIIDGLSGHLKKIEDQINGTDDFLFSDDGFVNEMKELSDEFDITEEILFNPENGIDVRLDELEGCLEYNCGQVYKSKKQLKKENSNAKKVDEKDGKKSEVSGKTRK